MTEAKTNPDTRAGKKNEELKSQGAVAVANARKTGINNNQSLSPNPTLNDAPAETLIRGKENTFIIMGRDRPRSKTSGEGAKPTTHVGCIQIVAGLGGMMAAETDAAGERVVMNPNPHLDAAKIYITQRCTDIDSKEYFHLAKGRVGHLTGRSAIAIKADSVRVIGREGIKLVTSSDTRSGASGLNIAHNIQGIDLIAGNDDAGLQPMVKGDDLAKVLDNLLELIKDIHSSVSFALEIQTAQIGAFTDPTGASAAKLGLLLSQIPLEVSNLACQERNFAFHKMNYSSDNPFAKYNFRSKYNNVN
jgi:hypothetical protein